MLINDPENPSSWMFAAKMKNLDRVDEGSKTSKINHLKWTGAGSNLGSTRKSGSLVRLVQDLN